MSRSQKYIVSMALVLALTVSGGAFAGSTTHELGGYTSPFDTPIAYQQSLNKGDHVQTVRSADKRLRNESQQASTVLQPQGNWGQSIPASRDDLYSPE